MTDRDRQPRRGVHHRVRVPAGDTCRARGFQPGDLLISAAWTRPRQLEAFDQLAAVLRTPGGPTTVTSFPPDIKKDTDAAHV